MTNSVDSILKKYGDIISKGTGLVSTDKVMIPISPAFDLALGGGVPEGSFVSFIGPPGCGKSTTVLQFVANATRPEFYVNKEPRKIYYFDVEHRLKRMNMEGVVGLNPDLINHVHSTKDVILTGNDYLDIGEALIKDPENTGAVIVFDSSSALCPADEMAMETSGTIRGTLPKMLSHWCKKIAAPIKVMDVTVIFIQHLITNTSGWGEKWLADGGEKIKYGFDVQVMTKGKPTKWIEEKKLIGQIVEWDVMKSSNSQSGLEVKSYLRYGKGLDMDKEAFILAIDFGIIATKGSWMSYDFNGETVKAQGDEKMFYLLMNNPQIFNDVKNKLKQIRI